MTSERRLRLACHGWVHEHAGSVASAGHVVLEELLRRGIHVDLFAQRDHVPPPPALERAGCRYFGFEQRPLLARVDRIAGTAGAIVGRLFSPASRRYWQRTFEPALEAEHARTPYDAVLTLGTTRILTLPGVPNVTWLQSPFRTELDAIRRLRRQIVSTSGWSFYALAVGNHRYKSFTFRYELVPSEHVVLPSGWSQKASLAEGMPADRTHAIPYPVDLEAFQPEPVGAHDPDRPLLVALGRLDPRKRLDLLLDAFALVLEAIPGARLRIVGRPGYAPNQLSLLERFPRRDAVEYREAMPRTEVPALLREATILVQTSENENFGSSVAEALACGTPVALGPSNGTADYIDERSRVFGDYEPGAVAGSILAVIQERTERPAEVRASTRAAAERWFAAPAVADRLLEILEMAIRGQAFSASSNSR
jgi:glycosyltransferase involved in cell wall biosynthesis